MRGRFNDHPIGVGTSVPKWWASRSDEDMVWTAVRAAEPRCWFVANSNRNITYRDQSAFVNISIFDREYIKSLFGGVIYPDGTMVIDEVDALIEHQKIFMEVVSEIRSESIFTFPVKCLPAA